MELEIKPIDPNCSFLDNVFDYLSTKHIVSDLRLYRNYGRNTFKPIWSKETWFETADLSFKIVNFRAKCATEHYCMEIKRENIKEPHWLFEE